MKTFTLLVLALSYGIVLSAQHKVFEQMIGWRGDNIGLHVISDRSKQQNCLLLLNRDSVKGFLLNSASRIVLEFGFDRWNGETLAGGFIKNDKINIYMHDEGSRRLHNWILDMRTGEKKDSTFPFDVRKEKVVDWICGGDHLLYFTINKKTSEFIFYNFHDEKIIDTLRYHFDDKIWMDLTKSSGFSRAANISKIDGEGDCNAEIAQVPNKLYLEGDSLYLLMNTEKGITSIFSFDTQRRQMNSRMIQHNSRNVWNPEVDGYTDNSYLQNGKLYFVSATRDSLCIQVFDFASGMLLKNYSIGRDEEIKIKNTPIIQEGGTFSFGGTRELGNTRQLIRKMVNGKAIISATPEGNGTVCLSVGSYHVTNSGGGGMFMSGGTGVAPTMVFVPTGGFSRSSWTKSAHFKMLLDVKSLEHIEGDLPPSINEKIEKYTKGIDIQPEGENLFMNNGRNVYAYYDKGWHKLVVAYF